MSKTQTKLRNKVYEAESVLRDARLKLDDYLERDNFRRTQAKQLLDSAVEKSTEALLAIDDLKNSGVPADEEKRLERLADSIAKNNDEWLRKTRERVGLGQVDDTTHQSQSRETAAHETAKLTDPNIATSEVVLTDLPSIGIPPLSSSLEDADQNASADDTLTDEEGSSGHEVKSKHGSTTMEEKSKVQNRSEKTSRPSKTSRTQTSQPSMTSSQKVKAAKLTLQMLERRQKEVERLENQKLELD